MLEMGAAKALSRVRIWDGSTPWLITGHEVARELFADARVSVDDRRSGFPHWNEMMVSTVNKRPRSVFTSDAEEHTRFRRMLSKPFTFKRVEGLRPKIQQITDEHIDAILAGPQPADIVTALALPVPTLVISEMLGVPYEDHAFFQHHANVGLDRYAKAEDTMTKGMSLAKYLCDLVEAKMACPPEERTEDAVSDLAERVTAGEIDVKEAAQLGTGLLIAGHETTANMIGIGVLALLENPEQAKMLAATDDPKVIANAVEELMRYLSIIQNGQRRVATDDIEIAGETIRGGEGIIIDLAPANWDAAAYPEPDRLDLTRDAGQQLGFGYGRHQCVGQQLARAELQIVFHTLVRRIPSLRLAIPFDEIPFKHDRLAYGVYELPVAW
jgi:cytochrome P450